MLPSADELHGDTDFIFQQDVAPADTNTGTNTWSVTMVLVCLMQTCLNLWGVVKRKMRDTGTNSADDLKAQSNLGLRNT